MLAGPGTTHSGVSQSVGLDPAVLKTIRQLGAGSCLRVLRWGTPLDVLLPRTLCCAAGGWWCLGGWFLLPRCTLSHSMLAHMGWPWDGE